MLLNANGGSAMPYIRLETTESVAPEQRASLCARLSRLVAQGTGKPEAYVMVVVGTA